jgi:hypothetical protein
MGLPFNLNGCAGERGREHALTARRAKALPFS